jgi:hypothetical protein
MADGLRMKWHRQLSLQLICFRDELDECSRIRTARKLRSTFVVWSERDQIGERAAPHMTVRAKIAH